MAPWRAPHAPSPFSRLARLSQHCVCRGQSPSSLAPPHPRIPRTLLTLASLHPRVTQCSQLNLFGFKVSYAVTAKPDVPPQMAQQQYLQPPPPSQQAPPPRQTAFTAWQQQQQQRQQYM